MAVSKLFDEPLEKKIVLWVTCTKFDRIKGRIGGLEDQLREQLRMEVEEE